MGQSQTFLSARIKLQKLHLLEWEMLVINQQKVWGFVREETAPSDDRLTSADLISRQAERLKKIMIRQRQEREQMQARHHQEAILLEQAFEASEQNQT